MTVHDQNVSILRRWLRDSTAHTDIRRAETGKINPDAGDDDNPVLYTNAAIDLADGYVWVRIDGSRHEVRARNTNVRTDIANIPVKVGTSTLDGELEVISVDTSRAILRFGSYAGSLLSQPASEFNRQTVNGRNIRPLRLRVWISGTLKVNAETGWYIDSNGDPAYWQPSDSNVVDLSSNVPAASGGTDQWRWVAVDLNPDADNPELVATSGTAQFVTLPLVESQIASIALASGYLRLGAVKLVTGDADESDLIDSDWADTRFWLLGGGGVSSSSGEYMLDDDGNIMLDDDGNIMRDDG